MGNQTGKKLPSGIVKFTITREKLKDILRDKYNSDIETFSFGEEGISIRLRVSEEEEPEEESEEDENEEEWDKMDSIVQEEE